MEKTVRDRLLGALKGLEEEELERFKRKLSETPLPEGFCHIPWERLQKADPLDLCDLLLSNYYPYALLVAAQVLEAVNLKREAQRLLSVTGIGRQPLLSLEPHFIEQHQEQLIQRTALVEGVLDLLYGIVLDDEQHERISSLETNPEKMRELYKLVPSWDPSCKDQLYEALRKTNRFLIADLEGR
uniref:apoptosis-associated speck-like protein containing a CARD n=1 Tax=Euleptes europaea TaxID=460621 RepID=UPI0025409250|nr:apoptosis-associated speck-like protein containing a CARD [Euleptes europaea]